MLGTSTERKQARYLVWMHIRGIDLTLVSLEDLKLSPERSYWYGNSGGPELDVVLDTLPITAADVALDIGCGKGGALITMVRHGFARVDGVELSPLLVEIAKRNLQRLKITNASIACCDAAEFTDLDRYTFIYLFNPFPTVVMERVLDNIQRSIERCPRRVTLVYKNPLDDSLVAQSGFNRIAEFHHGSHPFHVYESVQAARQFGAAI